MNKSDWHYSTSSVQNMTIKYTLSWLNIHKNKIDLFNQTFHSLHKQANMDIYIHKGPFQCTESIFLTCSRELRCFSLNLVFVDIFCLSWESPVWCFLPNSCFILPFDPWETRSPSPTASDNFLPVTIAASHWSMLALAVFFTRGRGGRGGPVGSSHGNSQGDYLAFSSTVWHRRQRQSGSSDVYRRHLGHRDRGVGTAATLYELSSRIMPPTQHTDEHYIHFCLTKLTERVTLVLHNIFYLDSCGSQSFWLEFLTIKIWNYLNANICYFLLHSVVIMTIYGSLLRTTDLN